MPPLLELFLLIELPVDLLLELWLMLEPLLLWLLPPLLWLLPPLWFPPWFPPPFPKAAVVVKIPTNTAKVAIRFVIEVFMGNLLS
jgi:hypothetical protein